MVFLSEAKVDALDAPARAGDSGRPSRGQAWRRRVRAIQADQPRPVIARTVSRDSS